MIQAFSTNPFARHLESQKTATKTLVEREQLDENAFKEMDAHGHAAHKTALEHENHAQYHFDTASKLRKNGWVSRANYHERVGQSHMKVASAYHHLKDVHHGFVQMASA